MIKKPKDDSPVALAASRLSQALESHGITADVHPGERVAALSVRCGLVVWCEYGPDGPHFRWWTGRCSDSTGRRVYAFSPITLPDSAAQRIALLYWEMVRDQWLPAAMPERLEVISQIPEQRMSADNGSGDG
ncbi:hypothetical protein [Sphaerisporangium rhizosphaerae]|uniref:Uncharacterized protein n=1 Tax=Sphaerisporangium rhizosphaerae TaxID=2269375 RepID=A0ABW2P7Z4_9ACTN